MNPEIFRHQENPPSYTQKKEQFYSAVVIDMLWDQFEESLQEVGFTDKQIEIIKEHLPSDKEQAKRFFSVPAVLREKFFGRYFADVASGKIQIENVVDLIVSEMSKYGYTIGYHLSNREIRPAQNGSWSIIGYENDHRDNNLPKAYYSHSFAKRYTNKTLPHLYVIRSETGDQTDHKQDDDKSWGRASTLSIIAHFDMDSIDRTVEKLLKEEAAEQKKTGT